MFKGKLHTFLRNIFTRLSCTLLLLSTSTRIGITCPGQYPETGALTSTDKGSEVQQKQQNVFSICI